MADQNDDGHLSPEIRELLVKLGAVQAEFSRAASERRLGIDRELVKYIYDTRKMLLNAARMIAKLSQRVQELETRINEG